MTRKPCRNARFIGKPRQDTITTPDGIEHTITIRRWELLPDWGCNSIDTAPINGFNPDMQNDQYEMRFSVPTPETRHWISDPRNPRCPLSRFVGNENARERLSRAAYAAWSRSDHCCSDQSFALLGPTSAGKTTLARLFGEMVMLPFIEIQPKSVRDSRDLFMAISVKLERTVIQFEDGPKSLKMVKPDPEETNDASMLVPPCVVFIDEVHALARNLVPDLLKATDPSDGMLTIENGWFADCRRVCWVIATTERGLLFPALDSRFRKMHLEMYGADDIARIVHLNYPTWNMPLCRLVSRYSSRVPREALAFAADIRLEHEQNGGNWKNIAARVARSHGIDRFGLTRQRLNILVALGQLGAVSRGRMCDIARCRIEELEKFVMPALLIANAEDPAMVAVTSQGYAVTWHGIEELEKRGIPHRGAEVVVGGHEKLDFGAWDSDGFGVKAVPTNPQPVFPPEYEPKGYSALVQKLAKALGR
jgi:Holliday junction resolvasome RuvABC ATP-dependent DNA helicase subunit